MARSIDDSLALFESSLPNINTALVNQGVTSTSGLKLSQVADKIKSIVVKKTGILRINQTVNYTSGFNYKDEKYITFIHTVHGSKLGYQNTDPIVGTKSIDIELEVGTYTFYKQVNNESAGDGAYITNFTSNTETVEIKTNQITQVDLVYTRATGSIQIQDKLVSNFSGNSRVYALIQHYLRPSNEYRDYFIMTPTYSWYGNAGGGTVTVGTINGVPTGLASLDPVHNRIGTSSSTSADYTWEINTTAGTGTVQKDKTVSIVGTVTRVSAKRSLSNPNNLEEIQVNSVNENKPNSVSDNTQTNEINSIEWNEELGCNIINGLPYYGAVEDYPNPLRKVYAEDYTGEIEKGTLTPLTEDKIKHLITNTD